MQLKQPFYLIILFVLFMGHAFSQEIDIESVAKKIEKAIKHGGKGKHDKGLNILNNLIEDYGDLYMVYYFRGRLKEGKGDTIGAITDYKHALDIDSENGEAGVALGNIYHGRNEFEKAIYYFEKALKGIPPSASYFITLGHSYYGLFKYPETVSNLTQAIDLFTDETDEAKKSVYYICGYCHFELENYEKAIEMYDFVYDIDSTDADNLLCRGVSKRRIGKYEEALLDYNASIRLDPNDPLTYHNRGVVNIYLNNLKQAKVDEEKAIELNPDYFEAYDNLGMIYARNQNDTMALNCYNKSIQINPLNVNVYSKKVFLLLTLKDTVGALQVFNKAIELMPDNSSCYMNMGFLLSEINQHDKAIVNYTKAISLDSSVAESYNGRGILFDKLEQYQKAVADFNKSIQLDARQVFAYNNRANTKFKLGNKEGACEDWNNALSRGYVYQKSWKKQYNIDDPVELIKKHCTDK